MFALVLLEGFQQEMHLYVPAWLLKVHALERAGVCLSALGGVRNLKVIVDGLGGYPCEV